jgi:hypothetical protein
MNARQSTRTLARIMHLVMLAACSGAPSIDEASDVPDSERLDFDEVVNGSTVISDAAIEDGSLVVSLTGAPPRDRRSSPCGADYRAFGSRNGDVAVVAVLSVRTAGSVTARTDGCDDIGHLYTLPVLFAGEDGDTSGLAFVVDAVDGRRYPIGD